MRSLGLSSVAALATACVAALAGCNDNGAHLTFQAPSGPTKAATFKVVLASPELVPTVRNQRVDTSSLAMHDVSYYLQRTIAGGTYQNVTVDGFSIRIEPDPSLSETRFIPFVIFYDEAGAVVGMGTYRAGDVVTPASIKVITDEIDIYDLQVEPVTQVVDDTAVVGNGQVQVVECARDDQSTFVSGIVWRPARGGEIRLLLSNDGGMDATGRPLDLDCDGREVSAETSYEDCDDTRNWFHREANETCDTFDTNCDGLQNTLVACTPDDTTACGGPDAGVALCNDRTGEAGACHEDPVCACANGVNCSRCMIEYSAVSSTSVTPCAPAMAYIYTTSINAVCGDAPMACSVEVLRVRGPWKVEVSPEVAPPVWGLRATGVGSKFLLQVKAASSPVTGQPAMSVGEVEVAVIEADGTAHLRMWDLQISNEQPIQCVGGGPYQMFCTP